MQAVDEQPTVSDKRQALLVAVGEPRRQRAGPLSGDDRGEGPGRWARLDGVPEGPEGADQLALRSCRAAGRAVPVPVRGGAIHQRGPILSMVSLLLQASVMPFPVSSTCPPALKKRA